MNNHTLGRFVGGAWQDAADGATFAVENPATGGEIEAQNCFHTTRAISTRFDDNDIFGHINNAAYYAFFDTVINGWLHDLTGVPSWELPALGVVANSGCDYLREIHHPQDLVIGIRVARLGTKSISYELDVWVDGEPPTAARARGRWVHVYVDPVTRATVAIPDIVRRSIAGAMSTTPEEQP